jgi:hypothetical protein
LHFHGCVIAVALGIAFAVVHVASVTVVIEKPTVVTGRTSRIVQLAGTVTGWDTEQYAYPIAPSMKSSYRLICFTPKWEGEFPRPPD